ncbi:MAG: A/G-specific adenine glycosylase [Dehalococcoidia bacterium]|nr:A/G-specific adenine glycosylase [Dehalococcoidia bacterium]
MSSHPSVVPADLGPLLHRAVIDWYDRHQRDLPWRRTRDPYAIMVAEVMLQQTQVDRVLSRYYEFLAVFPNVRALAAAPIAEVIRRWQGMGYNRRAVNLHRAARAVCERFDGVFPREVATLAQLPGVGRYTACAIACFAFEQAVPVVDTNVRRVVSRVLGAPLSDTETWRVAEALVPPAPAAYAWNQALMDLGATICVARQPACLICPVREWCVTRGPDPAAIAGAPKRARSAPPAFVGSNRYYRGRLIEALRALPPGGWLELDDIGAALRPDYAAAEHRPWVATLAQRLAADGLVRFDGDRVALP